MHLWRSAICKLVICVSWKNSIILPASLRSVQFVVTFFPGVYQFVLMSEFAM